MGYVREYRDGDCEYLSGVLRKSDRDEILAASGRDPLDALWYSASVSAILCTIVGEHEQPVGVFGVAPTDDLSGSIWLLGSDALVQAPLRRQFLVEGKAWLEPLHAFRPLLHNCVDERNTVHIRWLRWMGFTFIKRHPTYGVERRPFLEFLKLHHV